MCKHTPGVMCHGRAMPMEPSCVRVAEMKLKKSLGKSHHVRD